MRQTISLLILLCVSMGVASAQCKLAFNPVTGKWGCGSVWTDDGTTVFAPAGRNVAMGNAVPPTGAQNMLWTANVRITTPQMFGAKGDGRSITVNITATSKTLTKTSPASVPFVAGDVGKTVWVEGAGTAAAILKTTIAAYVSGTQVTLTDAAVTTVNGVAAAYGTDDTAALQTAITRAQHSTGTLLLLPGSMYLYDQAFVITEPMILDGTGSYLSSTLEPTQMSRLDFWGTDQAIQVTKSAFDYVYRPELRHFVVTTHGSTYGIYALHVSEMVMENVYVQGSGGARTTACLALEDSLINRYMLGGFSYCSYGIWYRSPDSPGQNQRDVITGANFYTNYVAAVRVDAHNNLNIDSNWMENSPTYILFTNQDGAANIGVLNLHRNIFSNSSVQQADAKFLRAVSMVAGNQFSARRISLKDNAFNVQSTGTAYSGTVNTSGTAVTKTAGTDFSTSWVAGRRIVINSVQYLIASVQSTTALTLASSAGTQTGVAYTATDGDYGADVEINGNSSGTAFVEIVAEDNSIWGVATAGMHADNTAAKIWGKDNIVGTTYGASNSKALTGGTWVGTVLVQDTSSPGKIDVQNLSAAQYPAPLLKFAEGGHATSKRTGFEVGDWLVKQDASGNGTKDFFFYLGGQALKLGTDQTVYIGGGTNVVYRCATAGALPAGALTITAASCGSTADTKLRVP